jgi:hypothetical protein
VSLLESDLGSEAVADRSGSLADKTMRLPMDNPIFLKLKEIVENAPKSPYWYVYTNLLRN